MNKKWFTLVELIIVMMIVIIIGTLSTVSYISHLSETRDVNRMEQIISIKKWFDVYKQQAKLPNPDDSIEIKINGILVWYQWYAWKSVLSNINFLEGWRDLKDKQYFSYYLTKDKSKYQLLTFLEERQNSDVWFISKAYALEINYSQRIPKVIGHGLWMYVDFENTPVQEIDSLKSAWFLDIWVTNDMYKSYISDSIIIEWTGATLVASIPNKSCKRIKQMWWDTWNGLYTINPNWNEEIEAYCDMETEGGWWTLVHKTTDNSDNVLVGSLTTNAWSPRWDKDNEYRMSIDNWKSLSTDAIMAKNIRVDGKIWNDIIYSTIASISSSTWVVLLWQADDYDIFNVWTAWNGESTCTAWLNYFNAPSGFCCVRCIKYNDASWYGVSNQPMVWTNSTSYTWSAVEWALWTNDASWHVLSKMWIFIR